VSTGQPIPSPGQAIADMTAAAAYSALKRGCLSCSLCGDRNGPWGAHRGDLACEKCIEKKALKTRGKA
jgi:hypothetical protein